MKFNLINPSDPYTFEADDLQVAAVMVCMLGDGWYLADALGDDADKGNNVPAFLLGGHDEWFTAQFGMNYKATILCCLEHRNDALARAFESVKMGADRRSSMNNIGSKAASLAKAIRRKCEAATGQEGGAA